jgi:hypothetical protein
MPLVRSSAAALLTEADNGSLVERMLKQVLFQAHQHPSPSEVTSWRQSLPVLMRDLTDAGLSGVEVLLEHHLPLTSKRADVILAGAHPVTGEASYVVVELKQWSSAHAYEGDPDLLTVPGTPGGPKLHPVAQVRGYCDYLTDFLHVLADQPDAVAGAAYLHNATDPQKVLDLQGCPMDVRGRLFTGADRGAFLAFLQSRLSADAAGAPFADRLLASRVMPSKQLLKVAADEVRHREQFRLLGEQDLAVKSVLHHVERAHSSDHKRVVVVSGGPGSGKSVIALSLLGELARRGRSVLHATGSRSFTQTLRQVVGRRAPRVRELFKYFNSFMDAERNGLDVLVLDEAHRIRQTSANRWTRAEHRTGRLQVEELMSAARVPVFLLDEHQVVRPGEMGSLHEITTHAEAAGFEVHHIRLEDQFRCGGSATYLMWVLRLLGLEEGEPLPWGGDPAFAVRVAETPAEMEAFLRARTADEPPYSARMSAGYCWPWHDPLPDGSLVDDVRIDGWARPWNLKGDRRVGGAPPAPLWATEDGGFEQVGCVYTAQGFEYDWSGVILGPDLVWRDGRMVSVRAANRDPDFRSTKTVSDADFDRLVRNVYKVLLTRGMVGTVLYSTDAETRQALRRLVGGGS